MIETRLECLCRLKSGKLGSMEKKLRILFDSSKSVLSTNSMWLAGVALAFCFILSQLNEVHAQGAVPQLRTFNTQGTILQEEESGTDVDEIRSLGSKHIEQKISSGEKLPGLDPKEAMFMGGVNYYNVHVLGQVNNAGTFKIFPSDRISDVLQYAGGILSHGSEQMIQLRRKGNVQIVNMFDYKIKGRLSNNPYLMENDVIFVPYKKGEIQIEGPVKQPGNYEVTGIMSLKKVVDVAGGFATGLSQQEPIRVIRYNNDEKKEVLEVSSVVAAMEDFKIKSGDIVVVPHLLIKDYDFDYNVRRLPGDNMFYPTVNAQVYVTGNVAQPGAYPFLPKFSYKDYVSLAGPLNKAANRRIKIVGMDGKRKNAKTVARVNPGDTIFVPERAITATNAIQWFNTITNAALTTFIFYDRFAN